MKEKIGKVKRFFGYRFYPYRKEIISSLILLSMISAIILLDFQSTITQITTTFGSILLASDYGVLKYISKPVYNWIDPPPINKAPENPIDYSLEKLRVNYFAKKYAENHDQNDDPEMEIIQSEGNEIIVLSEGKEDYLTENMVFRIYVIEEISCEDQKVPAPYRLGLARVDQVSSKSSRLRVIEWNNNHRDKERMIRSGKIDDIDAYVEIEMSKEVEDSDMGELRNAYESIKQIKQNRGQVPI